MKPTKEKTPLSVGYTVPAEGQIPFVELVSRYREEIGEVYYAFPDVSSGRSPLGRESAYTDFEALAYLTEDLKALCAMGLSTNLLFNASCGGADCMSLQHEREVVSILDYLEEKGIFPTSVTTTSPVTAEILRRNAPEVSVRASVNMRIQSIKGIQYVEHLFDSFCIGRDVNRDLETFARIAEYLHENGKTCSILVNSGCLRNCSMQSFHDNAVAHELEIRTKANLPWARPAGCRDFFSTPLHHVDFLQNTWIRPEDLHHYDGMVDLVKIATRMHFLPAVVIDAYARRRYHGNLADLFEPGHGPLFAPFVVDNDRFPEDWFETTSTCHKDCTRCSYCKKVKEKVFVNSEM